jgi:two-component system sensor histidine kinase YesM
MEKAGSGMMNRRFRQTFFTSIRFKLAAGVAIFLMPFLLLLIYNDFYAINVVRKQVAASNHNVVALYLKQIDSSLNEMDHYLANLTGTDTDLSILETAEGETETALATVRLKNKISKDILLNKSIDTVFIYSMPKRSFIYAKNATGDSSLFETANAGVIRIIEQDPELSASVSEGWQVEKINGVFYLLRLMKKSETYVGAWVRADKLLMPENDNRFGGSTISVFVTDQGEGMNYAEVIDANGIKLQRDMQPFYLTGKDDNFLVVGVQSTEGHFSLAAITPDSQILQGFPYIRSVLILIAVSTMVLMPLYFVIIRKTVLLPMHRLMTVMKKIRRGDMEQRIEPIPTSLEFQTLNETFNDMVTQIRDLKIDIYEEKINRQKADLERLQLQVKPHFYLNTLNIMNTLARTKNYELLQEMSLCLVEYFRYMFRSNASFVALKDELHHVRNYIRIQEMRFPHSLTTDINVSDYLLGTPVPPLIIHSFVENTIKHSVTLDEPIQLSIEAFVFESEWKAGIKLVIKDTGKGFAEEVLARLQAREPIIDEEGEHIGIKNVQQRLDILYGGKAELRCSNGNGGGAMVEMLIPLHTDD